MREIIVNRKHENYINLDHMEMSDFENLIVAYKAPRSPSICKLIRVGHQWSFVPVMNCGNSDWETTRHDSPHGAIYQLSTGDRTLFVFDNNEEFARWMLKVVIKGE